MTRQHTGRRRNDEARRAILDAAADLLSTSDPSAVTIGAVADRAGVGRQTIYRWWPSKGAVLLEALSERSARSRCRTPDRSARISRRSSRRRSRRAHASASTLRTVLAQAQRDPSAAELLAGFTGRRRNVLREILDRAGIDPADVELVVDQAFGVLWYRLLIGHGEPDAGDARRLADGLARQLGG